MQRSSGVLMHVTCLPGDHSAGSLGTAAREWIDLLSDCGFTYWQVLPFCLPDEYNSPYKSYSAFSGNPNFIDLEQLAADGLITADELDKAKQNTPYLCEFERLSRERMALLAKAAARFEDDAAMDAFFATHPHTLRFCEFMARKAAGGMSEWTCWQSDALDEQALRTWKFVQYTVFSQWLALKRYANGKGVSIIGDIPIYVALDSADVWAAPEQFQLDRRHVPTGVAGVPPDYFSADGQVWGNPLYRWSVMKRDGYTWWRERLAFMCELFDGVRIDHFRGLESYFSIPYGAKTAKDGVWKKGPGMSLVRALQEVCSDKLIIAEDLGDITPEVHALVEKSGFPGMRVLQFAFLGDNASPHLPHNYENNCVAYTGTHDNNTLLGYVWEQDEATRRRLLTYFGYESDNWDACYDTLMRGMLSSHAGLVIFPIQDILKYGSDTRLNTPGSSDKNWAYRVTRDQLAAIDRQKWRTWNELYGRV